MTPNDAAAVLEYIVEKRGAGWIATNWGLDREQLARWYEGQEELPPEMVFAMRVWVSAVKQPKGEAGCFEDADHPPEVVEDVTDTGWLCTDADGRPWGEPRIERNRGELLWDAYRLEVGPPNDSELVEMVATARMAWCSRRTGCTRPDS